MYRKFKPSKTSKRAFAKKMDEIRELYHDTKRSGEVTYIHASKTRIIDIYNDLVAGYELNGKGYRK